MHRLYNGPGLGGSSKATASTVCQKCLKKDIYECKATARPYVSRPSRTQQLLNPKLAPQLTSEIPNDLLQKKGVADEQLAKKEAERSARLLVGNDEGQHGRIARKRSRSLSSYSSDSVSTISTNRSPSHSPKRAKYDDGNDFITSQRDPMTIPRHRSQDKKRRRSPSSSLSIISESSHGRRSRSRSSTRSRSKDQGRNTRRRRGVTSPDERGRRRSSVDRRGGTRHRTRSRSMDRSQIARHRLSIPPRQTEHESRGRDLGRYKEDDPSTLENRDWYGNGSTGRQGGTRVAPEQNPTRRRERSLSPFSKRLALTQAMNMRR